MKVLILAGGFATRLWPLSEEQAKPLLFVGQKPLISHIVEKIPEDMEIIVSTNKKFEGAFKEWRGIYPERNIRIFIEDSQNEGQKLGAVGAINYAIENRPINEDLLIIAGDNLFDFEIADFLAQYQGKPIIAAYDIGDLQKAKRFGVLEVKNGRLVNFVEKPEAPPSSLVSTLCYIFPPDIFPDIKELTQQKRDNAGELIEYLLSLGKEVQVYKFEGKWFDIGSFEAYLEAHKTKQKRPFYHKRTYFGGDVRLEGAVFIGEGCKIQDSLIEDSIILDNSEIENCRIRNCVIDKECVIKNIDLDYKALRRGEILDGS